MITQIKDAPGNIVAFNASDTVTRDDYEKVVMPAVSELVARTGELNYLMVIDTPIGNFTGGAWLQDLLLGIKEITRWKRAAILTDSDNINTFTDIFSVIAPGEFRGFRKNQFDEAVHWVAGED